MEFKTGRKRKECKPKLFYIMLLIAGVVLLVGVGLAIFFALREKEPEPIPEPEQPIVQEETKQELERPELGNDVVDHIVTAGDAVLENFKKRPATYELT